MAARDAAKSRLTQAVTALEAIRLELLRLTAGSGSVETLTADLALARALGEDIDRLADAHDEVDRLLATPV